MGLSLHASRFAQADQKFNRWTIVQPVGASVEDCLDPGYWAHVASKLRVGDEIRVLNDEMTHYAVLLVVESDRLWAKVAILNQASLTVGSVKPGDDYAVEVEYAGPHHMHRVYRMRGGQKEVLSHGHQSKDAALRAAAEHMKTVAPKAA
jgi:16S rRNA U1498 N3-methylase RsmE